MILMCLEVPMLLQGSCFRGRLFQDYIKGCKICIQINLIIESFKNKRRPTYRRNRKKETNEEKKKKKIRGRRARSRKRTAAGDDV